MIRRIDITWTDDGRATAHGHYEADGSDEPIPLCEGGRPCPIGRLGAFAGAVAFAVDLLRADNE